MSRAYSLGGSSSPGMTVTDTYPGSLKSVKTTNSRFQPATNTVTNNGQTLLNLSLGYTSSCQSADNGNIATQTYTSGAVNNYCYNDLNEVASSSGYIAESWDFDPYGNRSDSYADANNRSNGGGYASDAAGNLTSIPGHSLTYLADDELHQATDTGYTYTYDGHERRFERSWSGAEVHYFYLGDSDKVIFEYPSTTPWEDYICLGNDRVANVMESGAISYYFTDHLGSTVLMTDGSGNVLSGNWPHAYTVFGADDPHYVAPSERHRYTGKERDPESGVDYFESRYYSSAAGRFLSPDEAKSDELKDSFTGQSISEAAGPIPYADIFDPQSLNEFAYTGNNPLRFTDPSGHCFVCILVVRAIAAVAEHFALDTYAKVSDAHAKEYALKRAAGDFKMALQSGNADLISKTHAAFDQQTLETESSMISAGAQVEQDVDLGLSAARSTTGASAGTALQKALTDDANAAKSVMDKTVETSIEQKRQRDEEQKRKEKKEKEQEQQSVSSSSSTTSGTSLKIQ